MGETCKTCMGRGDVPQRRTHWWFFWPRMETFYVDCPTCGGTGKNTKETWTYRGMDPAVEGLLIQNEYLKAELEFHRERGMRMHRRAQIAEGKVMRCSMVLSWAEQYTENCTMADGSVRRFPARDVPMFYVREAVKQLST